MLGVLRRSGDMKKRCVEKPDKNGTKEMRRFGFQFGLALNILGCIMFYRQRSHFIWFTGVGSLNLIFALIRPGTLAPLKRLLDFIIVSIGRAVNDLSLTAVFYLLFTPIGIFLRLLRKDPLARKIDRRTESYWIKRNKDVVESGSYERMG